MSIIRIFVDIMPRIKKLFNIKFSSKRMPALRTRNARIAGFRQRLVIGALRWGNRFASGKVTTHAIKIADKHIVKEKA